jgi:hypothetical protein
VEYLGETVSFFRLVGDVNPAVFETFTAFVLEMRRCKKRTLLYNRKPCPSGRGWIEKLVRYVSSNIFR